MKVIVQGLATEYQDEGSGKVIFLLHGWQDNLHTFDAVASILSRSNRVIRLDLPGFGESEQPKESWDLDDYVQFVQNFIQKLNLPVDKIVGHSFGGRIAIKGQATDHLLARKIILIGSAGIAKSRTARNSTLRFLAKAGGWITQVPPLVFWREEIRQKIYKSIGSDYLESGSLKDTFIKIIAEDLSENAKKITTPTLLIWGSNDSETPLDDGKQLSQLIQSSYLKIIDGAGHFAHQEQPQEVAKLIQEY